MLANPLAQSDAYARTLRALGTDVRIDRIDDGRCLIQTRRLPLVGPVNLISRGPVGLIKGANNRYLATLDLPGLLIVNSLCAPDTGFVKIAKPRTVALLNLGPPDRMRATLHQKWRNALCRAERTSLTVANAPYVPTQHHWLIAADHAQQKANRYRNVPLRLLNSFAKENPGQVRVITAQDGKTPVAGMLILCHRPWATYQLGVTTAEGRHSNAHNLTLWHAMIWLSQRGYTTLDLGLLTGPEGLDRFKLRTGATQQPLGGTWLRLPKLVRRQFPSIQSPSGQKA